MRDAKGDLRALGAGLVAIGNGSVPFARAFREDLKVDFPIYTDPSLATHEVMGLRRGVASTFSPLAVGNAVRAFSKGFRQEKLQGDPWQQGGVFVIRAPSDERFAYVSERAGDHPSTESILTALRAM